MGGFKLSGYALCVASIAVVLKSGSYFGLEQWQACAILAVSAIALMVIARYSHDYLDFPAAAMFNTDRFKTLNVHGCTLTEEPIDFDAIVARFLSDFVGNEGDPIHAEKSPRDLLVRGGIHGTRQAFGTTASHVYTPNLEEYIAGSHTCSVRWRPCDDFRDL